ncbi:MAG: GNAT family N-acetyltransferase [Alphaproteobacteria bacterium]|jgi:hypothetical protein|nr:GNAT family N-acetyltransferase [Alphaproteobacteria bacterium]
MSFFVKITLCFSSFDSAIFSYDQENCQGLRLSYQGVTKKGEKWHLRNCTYDDLDVITTLYEDLRVMVHFAGTKTRTSSQTHERLSIIANRYQTGIPKGGWVIEIGETKEKKFAGLLTIGSSINPRPGRGEIGRVIAFEAQGSGLGTSVIEAVVKVIGPEIRRWGIQQEMPLVRERFACFGGEALGEIYVTSAPANVGSWLTQVRTGFKPVKCPKEENPIILNYESSEIEDYETFQKALITHFKDQGLMPEKPYKLYDIKGEKRTVSYIQQYDTVKYHFTYKLS